MRKLSIGFSWRPRLVTLFGILLFEMAVLKLACVFSCCYLMNWSTHEALVSKEAIVTRNTNVCVIGGSGVGKSTVLSHVFPKNMARVDPYRVRPKGARKGEDRFVFA